MLTSKNTFFEMMNEKNRKIDPRHSTRTISISDKKFVRNISLDSERPIDISEISAYSSLYKEEQNKDYYDLKSQYLSDEIFFSKLNKKTINNNDPLISGQPFSLNHDNSENNRSSDYDLPQTLSIDFLKTGSLETTILLLIVSTIGGGLLSIPSVFSFSGMIGGLIYLLFFAILTYYSTFLLIEACDFCKRYSYCGLIEASFSNKIVIIVLKIIYFLNNWGILTLYVIRVNQLLTVFCSWFTTLPFLSDPKNGVKFFQIIPMIFMVLPQSLFRQYGSMRYGYFLGVSFLIFLMVSIVISSVSSETFVKNLTEIPYFKNDASTFYIVLFTYTCHNNLPDVFSELKPKSQKIMKKSLIASFSFCMMIYMSIGFFVLVYLRYPNLLNDNFLNGYKDSYMKIALFLFGVYIIFIMPIKLKPCKDALLDIFFPNEQRDDFKKHFVLTLISALSSLIPAMFINDPSWIIHAMGILSNPLVCFSLPTIFFLKLNKKEEFNLFKRIIFFIFIIVIPIYGIFLFINEIFI